MIRKIKISWLAVIVIISSCINSQLNFEKWNKPPGIFDSDVQIYYSYLPSFFIYRDLTMQFKNQPGFPYAGKLWTHKLENKKEVIKMSMGLSLLYMPFFLTAHGYCLMNGIEASGFSYPYEFAVAVSSMFYIFIGLVFLRKLLRIYFSELITAFCLLTICFGTNFYNYATNDSCFSHSYLFCLINLFAYHIYLWYRNKTFFNTAVLGIIGGLISLIRPTEILVYLIFILYGIKNFNELAARIKVLLGSWNHLILMGLFFMVAWIPQIIYWKVNTGHFLFFSYVNERFYFDHPHIIEGFFGYRKGWLLYSPLMAFSVLGFFFMKKRVPEFFSGIVVFFIIQVYVMLSWWCWWYGGSFGQRPFIDMYGLLALPMACLFEWTWHKVMWVKLTFSAIVLFLIYLSLFQWKQYCDGILHWDSMNKRAYWEFFLKRHPGQGWYYLLEKPDYEGAQFRGKEADKKATTK